MKNKEMKQKIGVFDFLKMWYNHHKNRPTRQELRELVDLYNEITAEIDDEKAMTMMDTPERWHYLLLLKIADYRPMGKSFSILTAYKLGFLAAQGKISVGGWLPEDGEGEAE